MATLDELIAEAKCLPEDRQRAIVEVLREMIDEPYQLLEHELAILESALADAEVGRNLVSLNEVDQRTRRLVAKWPK